MRNTFVYFLLKVYTVDNESALSEYIPFATTRIVQYDDYIIPSNSHNHIKSCLDRLQEKVCRLSLSFFELRGFLPIPFLNETDNTEVRVDRSFRVVPNF